MINSIEQGKDGRVAVLAGSDEAPAEIQAIENGKLRALTHHNDALLAELKLGATEEFTCKAKDGTEVHGLITKPVDYQAGRKYPTLLRIHGGPNGQDAHSFNFERQLFAANGYVVRQRQLPRQLGPRREVPDRHLRRLGQPRSRRPPGRRGPRARHRSGRSGEARRRRLELRRHPHRRHHRQGSALQSRHQRRRHGLPAGALRRRPVHHPVRRRDRPAVEGRAGALGKDLATPSCTPTRSRPRPSSSAAKKTSTSPRWAASRCTRPSSASASRRSSIIYPAQFHGITRPSYQKDRMERYLAWYAKYLSPAQVPDTATRAQQ